MTIDRDPRQERFAVWGALALGCLFDYLIYDKPPGIACVLFVGFFYVYFYCLAGSRERPSWRADWLFLLAIGLLSLTYGLFANPVFGVLNCLLIPVLLVLQTMLAGGRNRRPWYRFGIIGEMIAQAVAATFDQLGQAGARVRRRLNRNPRSERTRRLTQVGLGLLMTIPLLAVVLALLGSADRTFADLFLNLPDFWSDISIGGWIMRAFWLIVVTGGCYGYTAGIRYGRASPADAGKAGNGRTALPERKAGPWLAPATAGTVLAAVNIVYLLFTCVQFSYLFGAGNRRLPSGMTYADYAHRGFAELVAVTVINFSLLLGLHAWTRRESERAMSAIRLLLFLLIAFSLTMLLSAFVRLSMYQAAYGYTYLRMMVDAFMIYLLIAFMLAWLYLQRRGGTLAKQLLAAALACYVALNYVNIDARIAEWNLQRYEETGKIDGKYLSTLSADAVPLIARYEAAHEHSIPDYHSEPISGDRPWMSFNLAQWRAERALRGADE